MCYYFQSSVIHQLYVTPSARDITCRNSMGLPSLLLSCCSVFGCSVAVRSALSSSSGGLVLLIGVIRRVLWRRCIQSLLASPYQNPLPPAFLNLWGFAYISYHISLVIYIAAVEIKTQKVTKLARIHHIVHICRMLRFSPSSFLFVSIYILYLLIFNYVIHFKLVLLWFIVRTQNQSNDGRLTWNLIFLVVSLWESLC